MARCGTMFRIEQRFSIQAATIADALVGRDVCSRDKRHPRSCTQWI